MPPATLLQISTRADVHIEAGDWDAARGEWLSALAIAPDSAEVMLELSYVESLAGHHRIARDWTLAAAKAGPRSIDGAHSLVSRLRTFNEVPLLRRFAGRLLELQPAPTVLLVECARQLSNLNDFGLALQCAHAGVGAAPEDLSARLTRGQLLVQHGRVQEAASDFNWVLERNPGVAIGWWMLARLRRQTRESNHIGRLQTLLATPGLRPESAAAVARALHKELDDIGNHEAAWQALETMCRARRLSERHDPAATLRLMEALMGWKAEQPLPVDATVASDAPIFIVGMHRSGTTLLEQLLSGNPQVRGLGELIDFTSAMRLATDHYCKDALDATMLQRAPGIDFTEVGRRYLESVSCRLDNERVFVDKQPSNFLNVGFICQALPQARILHMVRDPMETCFSNLRELFSDVNRHSYDQLELADYYLQYRRLMAHWHAVFPGRIMDVDYAELTRNPAAVMRNVAAFCGIEYSDAMTDPRSSTRAVSTASSVQVRDKVERREIPKWAPYKRQLQPLITALRAGGVEIPELPA